eukprot:gene9136-1225_t
MGNSHKKQTINHPVILEKQTKVIFLGTGGSGKRTLFKNITKEPIDHENSIIGRNILKNIAFVSAIIQKKLQQENKKCLDLSTYFQLDLDLYNQSDDFDETKFTLEAREKIYEFWKTEQVQSAFHQIFWHQKNNQIPEGFPHLLKYLDRYLLKEEIEFDFEESLHVKTQNRTVLEREKHGIIWCTAGGVRSQRRKWIHIFDGVTVTCYLINLSGYRKNLVEDETTSRFDEEFSLFEEILNVAYLKGPIFLIFTMVDLFEESLSEINFNDYFEEFNNQKSPKEFIVDKFRKIISEAKCDDRVIIFEMITFDDDRTDFLLNLLMMKSKGETIDSYYPFVLTKNKPQISSKLFDMSFRFTK